MSPLRKDQFIVLGIYLVAFAVGFFIGNSYKDFNLLGKAAMAVFATVIILWLFSFISDNSSVFDPYWSVAPILFLINFWVQATGYRLQGEMEWYALARFVILFVIVGIYSFRLTYNFLRGWQGLKHEDWRYQDFRKKTGMMYWTVSLFGIHLFPALMVFIGSLSIWVALTQGVRTMGILDIVGIAVTGMAIMLEARADKQLHQFIHSNKEEGKTMDQGIWSASRHPNYLGEISFWWGLYFFALSANPGKWWVIIGPVAITCMFLFASIPMIEKRLMERRRDYAEYKKRVPMLLPFRFWK
jgi:steroid 5-alpha reductase family enzyme